MKLHTSFLEPADFRRARRVAGVGFTRFDERGSRKRERAFDIILNGSSTRRQNFGGEDYAATWDEWGIFLGVLFGLDPHLIGGDYESGAHFHWSTGNRFVHPVTDIQRHPQHGWRYDGNSVNAAYSVHTCQCGARRRWLLGGRTFADLSLT